MATKPLTHTIAGRAQVGLSYFFLAGFFALATAQGLGYLKLDIIGELKDIVTLVMSFWFMRQRESTAETPASPVPPTQPVTPAPSESKP